MKVLIKDVGPVKVGNSYYFLIPKQYVTNKTVSLKKRYDLEVLDKK